MRNAALTKPAVLHQPDRSPRRSMAASCPVSDLLSEAASILRALQKIRAAGEDAERSAAQMIEDEPGLELSDFREALFPRLEAIKHLASHRRAKSLRGTLFQLYIAGEKVGEIDSVFRDEALSKADSRRLAKWRGETARLHYAALEHLEGLCRDADLQLLRKWLLPPQYDVGAQCEQLVRDGRTPQYADAANGVRG